MGPTTEIWVDKLIGGEHWGIPRPGQKHRPGMKKKEWLSRCSDGNKCSAIELHGCFHVSWELCPLLRVWGLFYLSQPDTRPKPQHHLCLLNPPSRWLKPWKLSWNTQNEEQCRREIIKLYSSKYSCSRLDTVITSQFPSLNDYPKMFGVKDRTECNWTFMALRNLQWEDTKSFCKE